MPVWNIGQLTQGEALGAIAGRALTDFCVPLKHRLGAWWTGEHAAGRPRGDGDLRLQFEVDDDADPNVTWPQSRLQITQDVFGEGFIEPGGAQFARKLLSPADVDSTKTVLDLAIGLGGTAFTLVREQNVWMEALEPDSILADHARALARSYMLSRRVKLNQTGYPDVSLKSEKYDVIYARERLFATQHKARILKQARKSLKKTGKLLIIDYLVKTHDDPPEAQKDWVRAERGPIFPWTEEQYVAEFGRAGLRLRVSQDFSPLMVEQIEASWQRMLRMLESGEIDRTYVNALIREGELWLARSRALEKGNVTLTRLLAIPS